LARPQADRTLSDPSRSVQCVQRVFSASWVSEERSYQEAQDPDERGRECDCDTSHVDLLLRFFLGGIYLGIHAGSLCYLSCSGKTV
jgi:hypothetical protein